MGKHNDAIASDDDKVAALMWQAIATITYILDMMFVKLSIGVFLLRLSVKKVYNYIIWVSLVVVALYTLGVFFWDIFQCTPVAKQWDYRIERGHCATPQDIINAAYAISVLTVVSDWLYVCCLILVMSRMKCILLTYHIGTASNSHAMERQDDQAGQGDRYRYSWARYIVSCLDPNHRDTFLTLADSASIATLIRLRFLAGLEDSKDLLCKHNTSNKYR